MRRTIMMLFLFVMSIGIFAQESELEKKQREYRFATTEEKALMDSLYQPIADKLLKEQVKTIGGIPFGISHDKAETMLRNKFGSPEYNPSSTTLSFKDVKYAGRDFAAVHFLFQSDGLDSSLFRHFFCVFLSHRSFRFRCLSRAARLEIQGFSEKYYPTVWRFFRKPKARPFISKARCHTFAPAR